MSTSYTLPTLYCVDKKGKNRMWKTWVVENQVYKTYGEVGGKLISNPPREYDAKNIGRKNATTAEQQAQNEAERDWVHQLDKGYAPSDVDIEGQEMMERVLNEKKKNGNVNTGVASAINKEDTAKPIKEKSARVIASDKKKKNNCTLEGYESTFYPMHCQVWSEEKKVLKYFDFAKGVYVQPKLDGVRCLVRLVDGQVVFTSRQGKQFVYLSSLRKILLDEVFSKPQFANLVLDCELYAHTIYGRVSENGKTYEIEPTTELPGDKKFDVISGACRPVRGDPHPLEDQICAYVFDIADESKSLDQDERFALRDLVFTPPFGSSKSNNINPRIIKVDTRLIYNLEDVSIEHDKFALEGYEGIVIRSRALMYESHQKSLHMRKFKYFSDAEYAIVDAECDAGVSTENFTWVCMTEKGKKFNVKPTGTREQKIEWYENYEDLIGKMITVRYQVLSSDCVPRFPRAVAIRDYE